MNTKYFIVSLAALILLLGSCRKDNITTETIVESPEPEVYIETDLEGRVVDLDGAPIEDATIHLGNAQVQSDPNGYFKISATTDANRVPVTIRKSGYFSHHPTLNPTNGPGTDYLLVTLHPRTLAYEFNAAEGGSFALANGSGVTFAEDAIIQDNGQAYQGPVQVFAQYIDPSASDFQEIMPGNLLAIDAQNEMRALESYGMLRIELEDPSGNPLQISAPATLTVDVPTSLEGTAPATIPLWHFDEATGLWVEEGSATLQNGVYVGQVDHFSFWNCDVPMDFVYLSGSVIINGFETSAKVCATNLSNGVTMCTYTDDKGLFAGWVPNDELLEITVYNLCNEPIYSQNVGPLTQNLALLPFEITAPGEEYVEIVGSLVNCNNEPLTSGYIIVEGNAGGNTIFIPVAPDGSVAGSYLVCSSTEITIKAYDTGNQVVSDPVSFAVEPTIDLGQLAACGNDLALGVYISGDQITDLLESNTPINVGISSSTGEPYIFEYNVVANYAGGQVIYDFVFLNWTETLSDPLWGMSMTYQLVDAPEIIYTLTASDIVFSYPEGTEPGDLVTFDLIDATIIEEVSGTTDNGVVTLVGILGD